MGSNTSKILRLTPTKTETGRTIPQDIINEITDHLATDRGFKLRTLRACALISKSWVQPCRRHLFHTVYFTLRNMSRWFKIFSVPEESPAHHVKDLHIWIGGGGCIPERFFEYTQWFANAERMTLLGHGGVPPPRRIPLWRLPQSVTSLIIDASAVTLVQVRDIMTQLPNLDNLSLSGDPATINRRVLPGIGTALRGRFGGKLILSDEYASEDVIKMLLEIPSGLHFTEVQVCCNRKSLLSDIGLAEACAKTLVKLSYTVTPLCKFLPLPLDTNTDAVSSV